MKAVAKSDYFLRLARGGLRMPIGADLVLNEEPDPETVKHDAARLGEVVVRTARRYRTPLAIPLMDLTLEKSDLAAWFGVSAAESDAWQFTDAPPADAIAKLRDAAERPFPPRVAANQGAIGVVAEHSDLLPVGMLIGPFSLMTKLIPDPIPPVAMAGAGVTAEEDEGVRIVERCLQLATETVLRSARAQIAAGAQAILVCEPAANIVYLSPRQLRSNPGLLDRFVLEPNRRLRALLDEAGVDLIFHNCGELTAAMVARFANELHPAILSLGSSRKLWEDAKVVPDDVVLFGNLPTKTFYSDAALPDAEVERRTVELVENMARCGHPHIVGSECDVLHVPDAAPAIRRKVDIMMTAGRQ